MKKVLIINSAKGGVGKTETTIGIAKELQCRGETVSVIDLDITTPNVKDLGTIKVFTANVNMMLSKSQIQKLMRQAINDAPEGWIVVDTPPTISELYSAINETIKGAKFLFVTTSSKNAVQDTGVGIKFFAQRGHVAIGVVQNMTGGVFGETIDTIKEFGVPTIGEIPLTDDTAPYFAPIVDNLMKIEFVNGYSEGAKARVMSTLTVKEAERDETIPARFYNLETWDIMRERLEESDTAFCGQSHFSISTKDMAHILSLGDQTMVMVKDNLGVENAPLPYEIHNADIVYDNPVSRGTPMFRLANNVHLWHHECILVDDETVRDALNDGGFNVSEGRIVQSLFSQMYLNRAYSRNTQEYEVRLVKRHIEVTSTTPSKKELGYCVYKLERDGNLSFEDFDLEAYMGSQREDYPDFVKHLENLVALGN